MNPHITLIDIRYACPQPVSSVRKQFISLSDVLKCGDLGDSAKFFVYLYGFSINAEKF